LSTLPNSNSNSNGSESNLNNKNEFYQKNTNKMNSLENSLSYSYKKVIISDPFNNRSKIAEVAKCAKGVYIFEVAESNNIYLGSGK